MLTEKSRDLDMVSPGQRLSRAAVPVELAVRTFGSRRNVRNPCSACLYCAPRSCIIHRSLTARLGLQGRILPQAKTHI